MKTNTKTQGYQSPALKVLTVTKMRTLCASGSVEDLTENTEMFENLFAE